MADDQAAGSTILVVGGGISGLTTAVEAAEVGHSVLLVEKAPLPGRTSGPALSVFSQTVFSLLRVGDQLSARQE